MIKPLFELGQLCMTRGVEASIDIMDILKAIARHASGDWGELCKEDRELNEDALKNGGRLFSVYHTSNGIKFYVITEWDRSVTTVLLPEEY